MNYIENNATCDRRDDLISVLYGEANETETAQFQAHMQSCVSCQTQMRSFGDVRESIGAWKFEALSPVVAEVSVPTQRIRSKSAIAALREFFDLSPLWLKGATAFATVLFCLLAVLAVGRLREPAQPTVDNGRPSAVYTQQEMDQIVKKALDDQKAELSAQTKADPGEIKLTPVSEPQRPSVGRQNTMAKGRRPLSKWEREQLAADLRLLKQDDDEIQLLSEPINR